MYVKRGREREPKEENLDIKHHKIVRKVSNKRRN